LSSLKQGMVAVVFSGVGGQQDTLHSQQSQQMPGPKSAKIAGATPTVQDQGQ
jgi:hypothetical protein